MFLVENVRLRYYANNNAVGRATGIDMMLNGEFIDGVQSWMRMSFLRAEEDLTDDGYFDYYNEAGELIVPGFSFDPVATDSTLVDLALRANGIGVDLFALFIFSSMSSYL